MSRPTNLPTTRFVFPREGWSVEARPEDDAWIVEATDTQEEPTEQHSQPLGLIGWALVILALFILAQYGTLVSSPDLVGPDERAHAAVGHLVAGSSYQAEAGGGL